MIYSCRWWPARFIPTYVGHTYPAHLPGTCTPVHPHIRGAYEHRGLGVDAQNGSSPHTWGIRRTAPNTPLETGFIPTYVGHTVNRVLPGGVISGSSPHTWGILSPGDLHSQRGRFIPTYVGHTPGQGRGRRQPAVHPHIRGAYATATPPAYMKRGSSPHTWGIRRPLNPCRSSKRFIPTYVGHTAGLLVSRFRCSVHPHIRGAYGKSSWNRG